MARSPHLRPQLLLLATAATATWIKVSKGAGPPWVRPGWGRGWGGAAGGALLKVLLSFQPRLTLCRPEKAVSYTLSWMCLSQWSVGGCEWGDLGRSIPDPSYSPKTHLVEEKTVQGKVTSLP